MLHAIAAAVLLSSVPVNASQPEPIRVRAGETKVIDVGAYSRLAISQPDVAAVSGGKDSTQLTITGRGAGKTTLLVWQKDGTRVPYVIDVSGDAPANPSPTELAVRSGEAKRLQLGAFSRIAVGDPEIAEVNAVGNDTLDIVGGVEGRTTLMVWKKDGARVEYEIAVSGQANVTQPAVTLKVGETRHVQLSNVRRMALADPEIADVKLGEKMSVDLVGKREGRTALVIWYGDDQARVDYQITVTR